MRSDAAVIAHVRHCDRALCCFSDSRAAGQRMAKSSEVVIQTPRLSMHRIDVADAEFIFELVNETEFRKHIGDKGVRTLDDARRYIREVPMADYEAHGFGGYLVRRRADGMPIGICGLYKRSNLDHPDLGFALREAFVGEGYAFESAEGVIRHAQLDLGIQEVAGIVSPGNARSIRLLKKLGFERWGSCRMPGEEEELLYFRIFL